MWCPNSICSALASTFFLYHRHRQFGEVGVDDALVNRKLLSEEDIVEMNNGCICCTVRGDLIKSIGSLLKKKGKFDAIIIETTGLADPAPVAQTFFVDKTMEKRTVLDGIITGMCIAHVIHKEP